MVKRFAVLGALLAVLLATAGTAAAASPAVERAAAARAAAWEFAYAAYDLRVAAKTAKGQVVRRLSVLGQPDCRRAIVALGRRSERRAFSVVFALAFDALLTPLRPSLEAFLARLDRVAVSDPALVRGREAWRTMIAGLGALAPVQGDACVALDEWRSAGFAPAARPPGFDLRALENALDDEAADRALRRAAARMRRLGVPRGTARRFAGEPLFDDLVSERQLLDVFLAVFEPPRPSRPPL